MPGSADRSVCMSAIPAELEPSNATITRGISHKSRPLPPRELILPTDIVAHARQAKTRRRLIASLQSLDHDPIDRARLEQYQQGLAAGSADQPIDAVTVAHAAADLLGPRRAIEIGARRGFCAAAVASAALEVELHLMDRWQASDSTGDIGPVVVRRQLQAIGHRGNTHFHQGDSHALLPHLCLPHQHAPLRFDLVIVDGDRTEAGADQDLRDIMPYVAGGGVVVFDGLNDPDHPYLLEVWQRWESRLAEGFGFAQYLNDGSGVGIAMRLAS